MICIYRVNSDCEHLIGDFLGFELNNRLGFDGNG